MTGTLRSFSENLTAKPLYSLPPLPAIIDHGPAPVEWNATQALYSKNQTISQLFELQVEYTPESIAFLFGNQHLTYRELNARSNQLARYLRRLGVTPEARVALCLERSLEMIVALLAILKTGAAYVPLDPAYPTSRLAFMLEDSEPLVLLTQQSLLDRLPSHQQTLCLDTLQPSLAQEPSANMLSDYCFHLAQYLGKDQPFYALAPYDFTNLDVIPSIEEMATAHIQSIRSIQPEGPYLLGGFCNGGVVAYEMARQLVAAGELVENLILIDPAYSPPAHSLPYVLLSSLGKLFHLHQKLQVESFLRIRHLYKYARHQNTFENIKTSRSIDSRILRLNPPSEILFLDDNALLDWIIAGYSYPLYTGSIQLIWAEKEPFPNLWLRKTQQGSAIHLQIIPGTHIGCRTDHVQSLAEALLCALTTRK